MKGINKTHEVNIFINDERADIFSQDSLNLRFNNTFADPSKISTIQTEYTFSFTLPITKTNDKIFDYANILSKRNKFNKRFKTHVNVDGILIFDGELILQSINKEGYKCNLYINRLNTIDKIFEDTTLNQITNWRIQYNQNETINNINSIEDINYDNSDVFFPLVSYGMFQKKPTSNETYTSKHLIDDYATLYNENFYPSHNLLKLVEKCFEHKGYTVDGDIFDDEVLKRIYISTNLADGQDPLYNYGYNNMGKVELSFEWTNYDKVLSGTSAKQEYIFQAATSIDADLDVPKFSVGAGTDGITYANWTTNNVYDIWSSQLIKNIQFQTPNNILWRENRIVAPTNGFYKIKLELDYNIDQSEQFNRYIYKRPTLRGDVIRETIESGTTWTFDDFFTEFQLVRNSEDGTDCKNIVPDAVDSLSANTEYNKHSAYPHEKPEKYTLSTESDPYPFGYIPQNYKTLNYDPSVNKNFLMGCTTSGAYTYTSVIKNGRSWDATCADSTMSRTNSEPYFGVKVEPKTDEEIQSTYRGRVWKPVPELTSGNNIYGVNTLPNATSTITRTNTSAHTVIEAIVYLKKNDMVQLKMLQRQWLNVAAEDSDDSSSRTSTRRNGYQTDAKINLKGKIMFECFSPDNIGITSDYFDWNNETRFPKELDLAEFLPSDEKMSDFINNFIKEFNLSYQQDGKNISINKQKIDLNVKNAVDLTNRVSDDEIEMLAIDYPSQMSVEYTLNEDERGFYISAERNATDEQMLSNNWKDYADRGYDVIQIIDDEYATESKITTKTSFNWFEDFTIAQDGQNKKISIPVIAKDEWLIDGLKDAEFMKEDGYNLKRRYWFPSNLTNAYVKLNGDENRKVYIKLTNDTYNNVNLSYKIGDGTNETLLTRFFNIFFDADTNYIQFSCYLTTMEYVAIKNGSNILIDDDVYVPIEIQGYDASGKNKTQLKCIKK